MFEMRNSPYFFQNPGETLMQRLFATIAIACLLSAGPIYAKESTPLVVEDPPTNKQLQVETCNMLAQDGYRLLLEKYHWDIHSKTMIELSSDPWATRTGDDANYVNEADNYVTERSYTTQKEQRENHDAMVKFGCSPATVK